MSLAVLFCQGIVATIRIRPATFVTREQLPHATVLSKNLTHSTPYSCKIFAEPCYFIIIVPTLLSTHLNRCAPCPETIETYTGFPIGLSR